MVSANVECLTNGFIVIASGYAALPRMQCATRRRGTLIAGPILGMRPSMLTPRLCNGCEKHILENEGGAEVELTLLFADIRGSTAMAEQKSAMEYKDFIQRFYKTTSQVLIEHNALVNRLMGDQVIGLFVPRFAGSEPFQGCH